MLRIKFPVKESDDVLTIEDVEREKGKKIKEYLDFLNLCTQEKEMQAYLENNTEFIPDYFILNHYFYLNLVISQMELGSDYKTDFTFFTNSSAEWNIVHIELENPNKRYLRKDKTFTSDFMVALNQITRWKSWFENNKNAFLEKTRFIMSNNMDIPCYIKYLLVYGRSEEFEDSKTASIVKATNQSDFRTVTYDSLPKLFHKKTALATFHSDTLTLHKGPVRDFITSHLFTDTSDRSHIRFKRNALLDCIRYKERIIDHLNSHEKSSLMYSQIAQEITELNWLKSKL